MDDLVPERVDRNIPSYWTNALNVIVLDEGEVPQPTSAGATAVVRKKIISKQAIPAVTSSKIVGRAVHFVASRSDAGQSKVHQALKCEVQVQGQEFLAQ